MNYLDRDGRYWAEHADGTYWTDAPGGAYLVEESAETLAANWGPLTEVDYIG
jgi:hypothetical protein